MFWYILGAMLSKEGLCLATMFFYTLSLVVDYLKGNYSILQKVTLAHYVSKTSYVKFTYDHQPNNYEVFSTFREMESHQKISFVGNITSYV